jgi:hypothetical protein
LRALADGSAGGVAGERHQAEDFSFCQRWRTLCNGTVWALADANIGHIGEFTYQGNYLEHLKGKS